jgi:metal-sulfur cluster biosynthetic enzyme
MTAAQGRPTLDTVDPPSNPLPGVLAALDAVVDPRLAAMGEPLGLRELGLVTGVDVSGAAVAVTIRLTSPCCAYGPALAEALQRALLATDGVEEAQVVIDDGAVWTPVDLTSDAAARLARRRVTTVAPTGIRPHDWSR